MKSQTPLHPRLTPLGAMGLLSALLLGHVKAQNIDVEINVNVKHTVGGISTFDRSKFITVHSTHTDNEWTGTYRGEAPNYLDDVFGSTLGNLEVEVEAP